MSGTIYLIGGGEIAKGETQLIDDDIKKSAPRGSFFVFFPTAAGDSLKYSKTIQDVFGNYFNCWTATRDQGRSSIEKAIQSANVIYLGGGKTELLMNLFLEWNLAPSLLKTFQRGAVIAGMSAGAQALSAYYVDEEADTICFEQGWGLARVCSLVHAHENSAKKAFNLYGENRKEVTNSFVAIGEKSAWRISGSDEQKIGQGLVWYAKDGSLDTLTRL